MKKLLILILIEVTFFCFNITLVKAISKLHVEGKYIKNETEGIVYLKGVNKHGFEDLPEGKWEPPDSNKTYTWEERVKANLDAMKSWGMNVVRIHTAIDFWVHNISNFRQNIKDLIVFAGEKDMYVIFDAYSVRHYGEEGHGQDPMPFPPYSIEAQQNLTPLVIPNEDAFVEYWKSVASELKDYPNIIFEIFNEPAGISGKTEEEIMEDWHRVWQKVINAIRSTGADQPIIIQWGYDVWVNLDYPWPPNPKSDLSWVWRYPFNDPLNNLIYSTHIYRGGGFCHRSSTVPSWDYNRWQYDEIELCLNFTLVNYTVNLLNKPLLIGEIGANIWHNKTRPAPDVLSEFEKEMNFFKNSLTKLNEWEINYIAFWWWGGGTYQLYRTPNYQPNEAGEILINSINPSISGRLVDKLNNSIQANITIFQEGTNNIIKKNQTNSSGHYRVLVSPGKYDIRFDVLSIPNFFVKLISTNLFNKLEDIINYIHHNSSRFSFSIDTEKVQSIQIYSEKMPTRILANGNELKKVSSYLELTNNSWFYDLTEKKLYISRLILNCSDGTLYDKCAPSRPWYCEKGELIKRCDLCYCLKGLTCDLTSKECYVQPKILFEDDFEWGNLSKWDDISTSANDTVNVTNNIKYQGNYSGNYTINGDEWDEYAYTSRYIDSSIVVYARFYVQFKGLPLISGKADTLAYLHHEKNNPIYLSVYNNGTHWVWRLTGTGFNATYADKTIELNTWYSVEMHWDGVNGTAELFVNGSREIRIDNINNTGIAPYTFYLGVWTDYGPGNPHSIYFDDVVVSNVYVGP
jgi:hypothetical protein